MASLSSTGSVSGSSSLGNTSLRGFGGMVSGIQRDEIIEAMTLHTTNRITNQKSEITKLKWKQEAYQGLTDKILDLADNYNSYSSSKGLLDPNIFSRHMITVKGLESSTNLVTASGASNLAANVSLAAVTQMATSTVRQSGSFVGNLTTGLDDLDEVWRSSNLEGTQLVFGTVDRSDPDNPVVSSEATFKFQSTYKDENGKEQTIDYLTTDYRKLAEQLNKSLEQQELTVNGKDLSEVMEFQYVGNKMMLVPVGGTDDGSIVINKHSSALDALGYVSSSDGEREKDGIDMGEYNLGISSSSFKQSSVTEKTALEAMTGQKLTFKLDGSEKEIELITKEEAADYAGLNQQEKLEKMAENLQKRLNQAYGTGVVEVSAADRTLSFATKNTTSSISIQSSDSGLLKNMGLEYGSSNKVNLSGKLSQAALGITDVSQYVKDGELDLEINGVKIKGLTADSSISDIMSKINSSEAGVKATYVDATGTFMLVSSETGAGREINLNSDLAQDLFGQKGADGNYDAAKGVKGGQNAEIYVDYGSGELVKMERSSNTFNLEGMNVTVSGVFGSVKETTPGVYQTADPSAVVTFSAKADVEGVTEKVKSFFEDFNTIVKEINGHVTTRPDSSYGPLTDEQKDEMNETSIENWEKKAKEGLLYNDSTMRSLSMDVQNIFTSLMNNGASYDDLKKIGITYADDYTDGGTLVFDEAAFKSAMESEPELVSNIFTGGGSVKKGLMEVVDDTFTPYATRYASKNATEEGSKGSYGQLIEIAGTSKKPTTLQKNQIYDQLKQMQETLATLQDRLKTEQERYISIFTNMETMINQFNSQASYLSQISG
ncbi:MAG: flagellar filament capping protein FliD [Lachnospiraceae bacterium]|nr:flagellar filament capping protein FliD [Lachnospiraceae bacterium]